MSRLHWVAVGCMHCRGCPSVQCLTTTYVSLFEVVLR
jgi:hypothetical protein